MAPNSFDIEATHAYQNGGYASLTSKLLIPGISIVTDVRGGTCGTSRDVPIFVQLHEKIRTVSQDEKEKKMADLEKKI